MKKHMLACITLTLALSGTLCWASSIGSVVALQGSASAQGADTVTRELDNGSPVYLLDRIVTGPASKVQIQFADDTVLNQGERSAMVINEYVYAPDSPAENRSLLKLIDGVFRVVTDKITKLNPDRFEVKTNYGTIGIRGCDLGFDLTGDAEKVAVIALHTADSVVVEMQETSSQGGAAKRASAQTITEDGILASLSELEGLTLRPLLEQEVSDIRERTSPDNTSSLALPILAGVRKIQATVEPEAVTAPTTSDEVSQDVTVVLDQEPPAEPIVIEEEPTETTSAPRPPSNDDGNGGDTSPDFPVTLPRETLASGSGQDWSWSVWQQETFDLVDGVVASTVDTGANTAGDRITGAEFQAIANGGNLYNLSGSGSGGAVVSQGNQARVMTGTVDMDVRVGQGILPSWDSTVSLGNAQGDALNFDADGGIQGGALTEGNLNSYSLNAFGQSHGTPSSRQVSGRLVGPGIKNPSDPISGASLEFSFDHGEGGPRVVGAGGADLD